MKEVFFTEKRLKIINRQNAQKCTKKRHKKFFHFTDTNVYKNLILMFHFFVIWLSVKYKDFLTISNLSQTFHVFILLYKGKLKLQQESATCLLCTNILYFYLEYTWYLSQPFQTVRRSKKINSKFNQFQKVQHVHKVFKVECFVALLYFFILLHK